MYVCTYVCTYVCIHMYADVHLMGTYISEANVEIFVWYLSLNF